MKFSSLYLVLASSLLLNSGTSLADDNSSANALLQGIDFGALKQQSGFSLTGGDQAPGIGMDGNAVAIKIPMSQSQAASIKGSETTGSANGGFGLVGTSNTFNNSWSVGAGTIMSLSAQANLQQTANVMKTDSTRIAFNTNGNASIDASLMGYRSEVFKVLGQTLLTFKNKSGQNFNTLEAQAVYLLFVNVLGKQVYVKSDNELVRKRIVKLEPMTAIDRELARTPSYTFMVGVVPLTVTGSLRGSLGITDAQANFDPDAGRIGGSLVGTGALTANGRVEPLPPEVQKWGQILGQILGGARGYVDIALTLLRANFPVTFVGKPKDSTYRAISLGGTAHLGELRALDGKITAHIEMDLFKSVISTTVNRFCGALGFSCKTISKQIERLEKTGRIKQDRLIFDWNGSSWGAQKTLFVAGGEIPVKP